MVPALAMGELFGKTPAAVIVSLSAWPPELVKTTVYLMVSSGLKAVKLAVESLLASLLAAIFDGVMLKVAVQVLSASRVMLIGLLVLVEQLLQPAKTEPELAVAVSETIVPLLIASEQSPEAEPAEMLQLMPVAVTVPDPVPAPFTVRVKVVGAGENFWMR